MSKRLPWWVRVHWGGYELAPYAWLGPVLITWWRPSPGDRWLREYILPAEVSISWNPD